MAIVDKLGLAIFALWWGFAIVFTDGACPLGNGCNDLNYQMPALLWIAMRVIYAVARSRPLTSHAQQRWRTFRGCARFADAD